jgi:hypothetical protein
VADLGESALGAIAIRQKKIFGFYQQKRQKNKLILRFMIMIAPSLSESPPIIKILDPPYCFSKK